MDHQQSSGTLYDIARTETQNEFYTRVNSQLSTIDVEIASLQGRVLKLEDRCLTLLCFAVLIMTILVGVIFVVAAP